MKTYTIDWVEKNWNLRISVNENWKNWIDWYKPVYKYSIDEIALYLQENNIPVQNSNSRYYEVKEEDYKKVAESIIDDIWDDLKKYVDSYIEKNLFFNLA